MAKRSKEQYARERARRKELGQLRGLSNAQIRGHARVEKGERRVKDLIREGVIPRAAPKRAPRVTETTAGNVYRSADQRFVRNVIRQEAEAGRNVSIIVTFDKGTGPKTRRIDSPRHVGVRGPAAGTKGSGRGTSDREPDVRPLNKVIVTTGPAVAAGGGGGIPARDVLALIDYYGDVWDALYDLWDDVYK